MKKYAAITLLAATLVGCDNNSTPLSFTPEMASFSNEFDFDPLRGPVKDFTQTLFNEKGEVSKRVTGTVSTEGCFDTLELHDLEANTGVALVLDANYYLDAETQQRKVKLQRFFGGVNKQIGREEYEELLRRDLTSERNDLNVEGGEKQ